MEFLRDRGDKGYPEDYLMARIRGRQGLFLKEWDKLLLNPDISSFLTSSHYSGIHSSEEIRERYLKEVNWIYFQMNRNLRHIFKPYFIYSELETLLTCLRYHQGKEVSAEVARVLVFSLISDRIKNRLFSKADIPEFLSILEKIPPFKASGLPGLIDIYISEGMPGVERTITVRLLQYTVHSDTHPVINRFFSSFIDSLNIITLYKFLRWSIESSPVFISGGSINNSILDRVLKSQDMMEVIELVYRQTGIRAEGTGVPNIRSILEKGLTKKIKTMRQESPNIGLILHYLWRFSMETKNLSIILRGKSIDRNLVMGEMVS